MFILPYETLFIIVNPSLIIKYSVNSGNCLDYRGFIIIITILLNLNKNDLNERKGKNVKK